MPRPGQDDFVLQLILETARYLLSRDPGRVLFLDGRPFSQRYQIDNVLAVADSLHQPWRILECVCSEETVRRRLELAAQTGAHPAGNRDFEHYRAVKERFEAILHPKAVIDTEQPLAHSVECAGSPSSPMRRTGCRAMPARWRRGPLCPLGFGFCQRHAEPIQSKPALNLPGL